jgi:hypothetical protein
MKPGGRITVVKDRDSGAPEGNEAQGKTKTNIKSTERNSS